MNIMIKALFDQAYTSAAEAFGLPDITTAAMQSAIKEWFNLFFMREETEREDPSLRLPYAIINKLAKATFAEYNSKIIAQGKAPSAKAKWMNDARRQMDRKKQELLQWACVGGECFIKPVPQGTGCVYQIVRRDRYLVLGRNSEGDITDVGMAAYASAAGWYYTLLERRTVDSSGYLTIRYQLFASPTASTLGRPVPLDTLPQYADLLPEYTYQQPFGGLGMVYVRLPMINSVDGSADGVSIYDPAVQAIHNAYRNERQLCDEYDLGRARIMVSSDMLYPVPDADGTIRKEVKDKVFVGLDGSANMPIATFSPALRDESYERRKQGYLKTCENLIGLKRGILSDVEAAPRTAKEITSSEGDYNLSIIDLQRMYYDALKETLRVTDLWGQALQLCDSSYFDLDRALTVSWGNGILYDPDGEWENMLKMVQYGMLKPEIAIAWKYDLPWDTPAAIEEIRAKYMPELQGLMQGYAL